MVRRSRIDRPLQWGIIALPFSFSGEDGAWDGVELKMADLRGATGLTCAKLARTRNWQAAYRDPAYRCEADIPAPPEAPRCEALDAD